jgi:hypothetical protein
MIEFERKAKRSDFENYSGTCSSLQILATVEADVKDQIVLDARKTRGLHGL